MVRAIVLHETDNVATLLNDGVEGDTAGLDGHSSGEVRLEQSIPFGHKVSLEVLEVGAEVVKYGHVIGRATEVIARGQHVHVHNVESARGRGDLAGKSDGC